MNLQFIRLRRAVGPLTAILSNPWSILEFGPRRENTPLGLIKAFLSHTTVKNSNGTGFEVTLIVQSWC